MYAKLTLRNIRRSLRDYGIYFLTLVFAVAIFYVFNSLADQPALLTLRESTRRLAEGAVTALQWLTLIMTGVIALLVLYANRVIITKRNRELGTYLLLGMEQGRLSLLLLAEIVAIGTVALAVGLWQAAAVYRQKLLDLITGARLNEEPTLRSRPVSARLGLLTAAALGYAYWLADRVSRDLGASPTDPRIAIGAILGVVGTYLLFAALAGLLTSIRHRQQGWMGRGLNLFLYRQVTSKISTHATMLGTITLMLTFTICAMGFGIGLGRGMAQRAELQAPFDYMLVSTAPAEDFAWAYEAITQHNPPGLKTVQFQAGTTDLRGKDLMLPADAAGFAGEGVGEHIAYVSVNIIPASAYAELRAMKGYDPVGLPPGTYLIHASAEETVHARRAREAHENFLETNPVIELAGAQLQPATTTVYREPLGSQLTGAAAFLVAPDSVAAALTGWHYLMVEIDGVPPRCSTGPWSAPPSKEGTG